MIASTGNYKSERDLLKRFPGKSNFISQVACTKHPDADWLCSLKLCPKGEAVYIWQHKEEGPCLSWGRNEIGLCAGERRGEPGGRQQNSSILQLKSCAQRSPSPTHKWVPHPPHKLYSDPTQSHSDMKASGNRQPTTTENSEPISSAIVKYNYQVGELGE